MKLVSIHKHLVGLLIGLILAQHTSVAQRVWSLEECLDTTLRHNPSLEATRVGRGLSAFRSEEVQALRLPRVSVGVDYKYFTNLPYQLLPLSVFNGPEGSFREAQFGVPHNAGASIQAAWPIFNPQLKSLETSALLGETLAELQQLKTEEQLWFEVTNLYYTAQLLQQQEVFLDSNILNTNRLLDNITLLKSQGLAKATDQSKVALQQAQLLTQRQVLASQLEQTKNGLKWLMGVPLEVAFAVAPINEATDEEVYYTSQPSLDGRLAQAKLDLVQIEQERLKRSRLPQVSVVANYGLTGFGYGQGPSPFFKIFPIGFVGFQASYALWDAPSTKKIAQKRAEQQQQTLQLRSIETKTTLEMTNAALKRRSMQYQKAQSLQQIKLAELVYKETALQQQQGVATLTDLLLADNVLRETQQGYLTALVNYLRADLELKKAATWSRN